MLAVLNDYQYSTGERGFLLKSTFSTLPMPLLWNEEMLKLQKQYFRLRENEKIKGVIRMTGQQRTLILQGSLVMFEMEYGSSPRLNLRFVYFVLLRQRRLNTTATSITASNLLSIPSGPRAFNAAHCTHYVTHHREKPLLVTTVRRPTTRHGPDFKRW